MLVTMDCKSEQASFILKQVVHVHLQAATLPITLLCIRGEVEVAFD